MPRIEIWLVWLESKATPGVNRTMSEKSLMPFWSIASWLMAVMLIGTRLMLSSRRVAVTTISSRPTVVAASGGGALGWVAPAKAAAQAPVVTISVRKNNTRQ